MRRISDRLIGCAAAAVGIIISVTAMTLPEKVTGNEETACEETSEYVEEETTEWQQDEEAQLTQIEAENVEEAEGTVAEDTTADYVLETETVTEVIYHFNSGITLDRELQEYIERKCRQEEISYPLILAVMWVETRWDWHDGDSGMAIGYMQIWPSFWEEFADSYGYDIYDHCGNIACGIKIIKFLTEKNDGDLYRALSEYNTGNPEIKNGYADMVLEKAAELEEMLYD